MDAKMLLSDEFVKFSSNIAALHDKQKQIKDEFKVMQTDFKKRLADLDQQALEAQNEFDQWVAQQDAGKKA